MLKELLPIVDKHLIQYAVEEVIAVASADDFLTVYAPGVTADLAQALASSGKSQLLVREVDGPDISKYGVLCQMG